MQRDAHYAIIKIQHELRPAGSSNIDTLDPSKLVIDLGTDESFFLQENQLLYQDPYGVQELVIEGDGGTRAALCSQQHGTSFTEYLRDHG